MFRPTLYFLAMMYRHWSPSSQLPLVARNQSITCWMLTTKSDRIRALTAYAPPPMFTTTSTGFDSFRPITESDLRLALKSVNLSSCELDPLPPFIMSDRRRLRLRLRFLIAGNTKGRDFAKHGCSPQSHRIIIDRYRGN